MATPYNKQNALASSIAQDLNDEIANKVVLTTGVTLGGLGAHFVKTIAKHNPYPESSNTPTRLLILDLSSFSQIRQAAAEVLQYSETIDVVVNSAGIMGGPHQVTEDNIEMHFAANHMGHFLFTNLIMPKVLESPSPRIVNVSSAGHRFGAVHFDDHNFEERRYRQFEAYGQSKTANILFSRALATKLGPRGLEAYSLHPGTTHGTSLAPSWSEGFLQELRELDREIGGPLGDDNAQLALKTMDECAATHVVAAFDRRLDGHNGAYLVDGNLADADRDLWAHAKDPDAPEKLWQLSEKLVGQTFEY